MIQNVPLERLRLGWLAAMLDVLTALACYVAAYRLRFAAADVRHFVSIALVAFPLIAGVHVSALAITGLYTVRGQVVWPLRLVVGTAIGVPLGLLAAVWLVGAEGLSRLAIAGYGFMFGVAALAWRAAAGLGVRWASLRRAPPTHSDLEMQGAAYRSMTGGLLLAFQYRDLLRNLVIKDLKLKYRGSVLGFVWSLLNPLVMIVVYTFAFTHIMGIRTERYSFFVLIGVLTWGFFANAIMGSTDAITGGGGLLRSVLFPRIILPVSGVVFFLVQYLLTVAVLLPLMLAYHRIPLGPQMLLFPVILFLQVLMISGLALALSAVTAFFRDLKHLVEVGLGVAFWVTPIVYESTRVPEPYRPMLLLSPMAPFILAYQDLFYYLRWPDASVWLVAIAYGVTAFMCGISVFVAYEDRFSEVV
jgi:homopolymeric O-antigen transport system permease protein